VSDLGGTSRTLAARVFLAMGRVGARLPAVRGKTRLLLLAYRALGLAGRHVFVDAHLRRPVRFVARLDLHAWLQRVAFLTGGYEEDTVEFLLELHRRGRPGGYLLDVGANIGLIGIPFAKRAASRRPSVVAVEAVPDNVAVLRQNIRANQLDELMSVVPFALGAVAAIEQMQVEGNLVRGAGTGTANILATGTTHECVRQEIVIHTLDELAAAGEVPDGCSVIKIDTDGYDLKVLQGGPQFLARNRPVIFGEFSEHCLRWHRQSVTDVAAFAEAHGFAMWQRAIPSWRFTRWEPGAAFDQDLLLVPHELVPALESLLA
jgi:FkbM family methyltransferase